jgi:hypothetical protein
MILLLEILTNILNLLILIFLAKVPTSQFLGLLRLIWLSQRPKYFTSFGYVPDQTQIAVQDSMFIRVFCLRLTPAGNLSKVKSASLLTLVPHLRLSIL